MNTRCKFRCNWVVSDGNGKNNIDMSAVTDGSAENKDFWEYTPSGSFVMSCVNPNVQFVSGKEYYLDITEAPVQV